MIKYIFYRILLGFITLITIIVINYSIFYYLTDHIIITLQTSNNHPNSLLGSNIYNSLITNQIIKEYNLSSYYVGLKNTIVNLLSFNFGLSIFYNKPVFMLIISSLKNSFFISFGATIIVYCSAFIVSYIYLKYKQQSYILYFFSITYATPIFVLAYLLIRISENYQFILAILSISLNGILFLILLIINIIKQQNQLPSVLFFKQNNLKINIIKLQNISIILMADFAGIVLGILFGSSAIIEIIYNINGIGSLMYSGFKNLDYPLLISIIYIISIITICIKLIVDIAIFKIDNTINNGSL